MTLNKYYIQNPDIKNAFRLNVMEEWRSPVQPYFSQLENQQKNLDPLQHICFHNMSAVLWQDSSVPLCPTCIPQLIRGRQCELRTKPSTCPVCGIYHLGTLTWRQPGKTGLITLFYNWESKQKKKKYQKHVITPDVQLKTPNSIFQRMCHLKLCKYSCHQQQLQEARTSAEQVISTHAAKRKRGTSCTKLFRWPQHAEPSRRLSWQKQT